jgi:hypothetical protein
MGARTHVAVLAALAGWLLLTLWGFAPSPWLSGALLFCGDGYSIRGLNSQNDSGLLLAELAELATDLLSNSRKAFKLAEITSGTLYAGTQALAKKGGASRALGESQPAQHSTAQHSTAQHSTAQHSTAQHSTAQHSTVQGRLLAPEAARLDGSRRDLRRADLFSVMDLLRKTNGNLEELIKKAKDNQAAVESVTGAVLSRFRSRHWRPAPGAPPRCDGRSNMASTWTCTDRAGEAPDCRVGLNCTTVPDNSDVGECLLSTRGFRNIVYIGDSIVGRLVSLLAPRLYPGIVAKEDYGRAGRCDLGEFLLPGFRPTFDGQRGNDSMVGPYGFGLEKPGCQDCSGCDSYRIRGTFKGETVTFHYLSVEFTKDRELQTSGFSTTQELVAHYLASQVKPDLIFLGQSAHDLASYSVDASETEKREWRRRYLAIADNLLRMLHGSSSDPVIVYSVLNPVQYPNGNEAVNSVLPNITAIVDTLPRSVLLNTRLLLNDLHLDHWEADKLTKAVIPDGVHPISPFFTKAISVLVGLLCPFDEEN